MYQYEIQKRGLPDIDFETIIYIIYEDGYWNTNPFKTTGDILFNKNWYLYTLVTLPDYAHILGIINWHYITNSSH